MTQSKKLMPINPKLFWTMYAQVFFQGLVFWYAIEKLFMSSIGFNAATIGQAVAFCTAVTFFSETPLGILADRWSRKYILALTPLSLGLAALLCGLATNPALYFVGLAFFGLGMALASGNSEAIIYDTLVEKTGSRNNYEKYYGRHHLFHSAGLVSGSLIGGLIANHISLQAAYFLSMPAAVISVFLALSVKEPTIHKKEENPHILLHLKEMLSTLRGSEKMRLIVIANVSILIIPYFLLEVDQLWALALGLPIILYGPLNALLLGSYGAAGLLGNFLKNKKPFLISLAIGFISILWLSINSMAVVAIALSIGIAIFCALEIVANGLAQDQVPSNLRSGILSAFSTLSTIFYIPLVVIFGHVTQVKTVFFASYMLIPIAAIGIFFIHKAYRASEQAA